MSVSSFHLLRQAAVAATCGAAMFVGVSVVGLTPGADGVAVVYAQPEPTRAPPRPSATPEEPSLVLLASGGLGMLTYGLMRLRARK
jgi:hypothetical protein